jgi:hypothetical protein
MLNSIQHLTKSRPYEILKQVQDDKIRLFTRPSNSIPSTNLHYSYRASLLGSFLTFLLFVRLTNPCTKNR